MKITKRNGTIVEFDSNKLLKAIHSAFRDVGKPFDKKCAISAMKDIKEYWDLYQELDVETVQDIVVNAIAAAGYPDVATSYNNFREHRAKIRNFAREKMEFIDNYINAYNTADATIDDNSNVANKNIAVMNVEIHKEDNIEVNREMVMCSLEQLFPDFDRKKYLEDLLNHVIYKHDESTFTGAVAPYCASISMYPFLLNGIAELGGMSACPKNLDSFCGIFINMVFAISRQFAGAVATSEFFVYMDYFCRKLWGDDYIEKIDKIATNPEITERNLTVRQQIHQCFQQVIYSINQPSGGREAQSAFVNFSYFDKPFFESMFGHFIFPDGSKPIWETLRWLQFEFMEWFAAEREKIIITFPVESFAFVYKDGKFEDEESARDLAKIMAKGHCPFIYISDTVDSLSSCCRLRNALTTKEFSFTNGNLGIQTGSKSVITMNLNRLIQDYAGLNEIPDIKDITKLDNWLDDFCQYQLSPLLDRIYKYHMAYDSILYKMKDAKMLPVYSAGFINLDKQYLTIGINGENEAAEYIGIPLREGLAYKHFAQKIFGFIKSKNEEAKQIYHKMFNTEFVPAESLGVKNYNWDKKEGYWVPDDRNLYASYMYLPSDNSISVLEKMRLHGRDYIGDYMDGGSAAHINLEEHLDENQYFSLMKYAAEQGCQYFTFNIPYNVCQKCGKVTRKAHIDKCECGGDVDTYTRIIGYLTNTKKWSKDRRQEFTTRNFENFSYYPNNKE